MRAAEAVMAAAEQAVVSAQWRVKALTTAGERGVNPMQMKREELEVEEVDHLTRSLPCVRRPPARGSGPVEAHGARQREYRPSAQSSPPVAANSSCCVNPPNLRPKFARIFYRR